ncbi:hypothetical protein [Micromonospora echinospora]|uniref:hypothetical protein n=1 Tax=Micromonospora echinospora TaxID=1877 RepID=UPI00366E0A93
MRINRLPHYGSAAAFCRQFGGGCWSGPVSPSMISRWETGRIAVPYLAVRRYEELLGIPPGGLTSLVNALGRYAMVDASVPSVLRAPAPGVDTRRATLDTLVEKACSRDRMSGDEWDRLTTAISLTPDLLLVPSSCWRTVTDRLLMEMLVATDIGWTQRFEGFHRLLGHPVGARHAIASCADLARDPTNQAPFETVSMLDASRHPEANAHLLREITEPTSGATRYAALTACVRKIRHGHFGPEERRRLAAQCRRIATGASGPGDAAVLAAHLLAEMGTGRASPAALATSGRGAVRPAAGTAPAAAARAVLCRRVIGAVVNRMPDGQGAGEDGMLRAAVAELLFSPVADRRFQAMWMLRSTPYGAHLCAALRTELRSPAVRAEAGLATAMVSALGMNAGPAERALLSEVAVAAGAADSVVVAAVGVLGDSVGRSSGELASVLAFHVSRWLDSGAPVHRAALDRAVFALGMATEEPALRRVRDDPRLPASSRDAARWWLNLPDFVRSNG